MITLQNQTITRKTRDRRDNHKTATDSPFFHQCLCQIRALLMQLMKIKDKYIEKRKKYQEPEQII